MADYDNWAAALLIGPGSGAAGFNNSTNTTESGEPPLASGGDGKTAWFKLVPTTTGTWQFNGNTQFNEFRTAIDVYKMSPGGSGIADLVHLGGDVSANVFDSAEVFVALVSGQSYWIRFDSIASSGGAAGVGWGLFAAAPPSGGWGVGMVRMGAA